ncbi:MAG: hypothetical protein WCL08_01015 [Verrucomicrobiota bacterium]
MDQHDFDSDNLTAAQRQKLEKSKECLAGWSEEPKEFGGRRRVKQGVDKSPYSSDNDEDDDDEE